MSPLLLFVPLIWALWRRFDVITITLATGMVLSVSTIWQVPEAQQHIGLAIIDFMVAAVLALLVSYHVNKGIRGWNSKAHRAQFITILACLKVTLWIAYHTGGFPHWNTAAAISNALLLYQILVAGGVGYERVCRAYHSVARAIRNYFRRGEDRGVA
jgi:peptidoglycan/LPS O-acetylase OafA/YrhL